MTSTYFKVRKHKKVSTCSKSMYCYNTDMEADLMIHVRCLSLS